MMELKNSDINYIAFSNVWNEEKRLQSFFKRFKQIKYPKLWIFIEDGSTDGTKEELEKARKKYPHLNIRIYEMPVKEKGNLDTLSIGLKKALKSINLKEFDFIAKIDPDITFNNHYFEVITKRMKNDPLLGCTSGTLLYNGKIEPNPTLIPRGPGMVIRRDLFENCLGFIPDIAIDSWIVVRAEIHGFKVGQFTDIIYKTLKATTSTTYGGQFRAGKVSYHIGESIIVVLAKYIYRSARFSPKAGLDFLRGYINAYKHEWKLKDEKVRNHVYHYGILRILKRLIHTKGL